MAASAVIGALRVNLGLNSGSFRSGLQKSGKGLADFTARAAIGFAALTAAAAGAFRAISKSAESADEMIKASRATGIYVQELSRLRYGAELSGSSFEDLQKVILAMSKTVGQSLAGMNNEATKAFKILDISLTDVSGNARKTEEILKDVADRFSKMPDGVEKTSLAIAALGRRGPDLISFLNEGREGMDKLGVEAERLGLVFDTKTGKASERFNDNLSRMGKVMEGLWNKVLENVIPVFADLTDKFSKVALEGEGVAQVSNLISRGMILLANAVSLAFDNVGHLFDIFKLWIGLRVVFFVTSVVGGLYQLAKAVVQVSLAMKVATSITRGKVTAILLLGGVIAKLTGKYEGLVDFVKGASKDIYDALPASLKDGIVSAGEALDDLTSSIDTNRKVAAGALETFIGAESSVIGAADRARISLDKGSNSATRLAAKGKDSGRAWSGLRTVTESVNQSIYAAAERTKNFAAGVRGAFEGLGASVRGIIDQTTSWQDALKGVLQALLKVVFQQSVLGTLDSVSEGGGAGSGFAGLASGFFKGLMGFATGGSFQVGGVGGTDSQLVQFMASPDEVVSVMTPQQQKDANRSGGGVSMPSLVGYGGGVVNHYNIDAKGAELGVEERIVDAIKQYHETTAGPHAIASVSDFVQAGNSL